MPLIEYTCLVEDTETVHVIKPDQPGANDNQYVIIFEGARDWSLACISGDWEWESVTECMSRSASYLADPAGPGTKTFAVGSMAHSRSPDADYWIGAELRMEKQVPSNGDSYGRLTIQLDSRSQEPFFHARSWKGMDDRTFRIHRENKELERLGRLFQRLEEASYEPMFTSAVNNWFIPWHLKRNTNLAWLALAETQRHAVAHIREHCPEGFAKFWLESIANLELPSVALCPKCDGYFPRPINELWKKVCLGCYQNHNPTSFTREEIRAASSVTSWLVSETT